jgi:hypothetical protein
MMKEEFEKRIGLVITAEEYAGIEASYMGLPESVDKDKFAKMWLREGGIQDLFDKRMWEITKRNDEIKRLREDGESYLNDMNKNGVMVLDLRQQNKALKDKLAAIGAVAMEGVA